MNDDLRRRDVVGSVVRGRRSTPGVDHGQGSGVQGDHLAAVGLACQAVLAVADFDFRLTGRQLLPAARADPKDVVSLDYVVELKK